MFRRCLMVRKLLIMVTLYLKPWNWAPLKIQPTLVIAHSTFTRYGAKAQVSGRWERPFPGILWTWDYCPGELLLGVLETGREAVPQRSIEELLQEQSFPGTGCEMKGSSKMDLDHLGICFRLHIKGKTHKRKNKQTKTLQRRNCLVSTQNDAFAVYGLICSEKTGKLCLIMLFPPLVFINNVLCNYKQHFSGFSLWNTLQLSSLGIDLLLWSKLSPWFALAFTKSLA